METFKEVQFKTQNGVRTVRFGMPDTCKELEDMYRLRYDVYSKLNYISGDSFPDGIEQDRYDKEKKCDYFIAVSDGKILGSARLVEDYHLPTEQTCFRFQEPPRIKEIPRSKRGEIGRLVISREQDNNEVFPPHLVLLGIVDSIMILSFRKDLIGGYSFIKKLLAEKLRDVGLPFYYIEPYTQIYSEAHLRGYFNNPQSPVVPIYYFRDEAKDYLDRIFHNRKIFREIEEGKFMYLLGKSAWEFWFRTKISSVFH